MDCLIKTRVLGNGILEVQFNREEKKNAINKRMITEIINILNSLNNNEDIFSVIITGGENIFSSGRDFEDLKPTSNMNIREKRQEYRLIKELHESFINCPVPTFAAVQKYSLGLAAGIMSWCDYVILSHDTKVGFPEVKRGIFPGFSPLYQTNFLPPRQSFELIVLGRLLKGEEVLNFNLANEIVNSEEVYPKVLSTAKEIEIIGSEKIKALKDFHKKLYLGQNDLKMEYSLEMMTIANITGEMDEK